MTLVVYCHRIAPSAHSAGRKTPLVIFLHSQVSRLAHLRSESSSLKTHLLVDGLILSWVPLGSLVGGGWDLAGGLAKGLGGWGGHLDGISLKDLLGVIVVKCRWASIALWREEFRKCCVWPAKGLSEIGGCG